MTPVTVLQNDQTDCGPAAVCSILRFHGGDMPLARIRELAGTGPAGTTLAGLAAAAEAMGLEAEGARGDYAALAEVELPCIAHVVLENGLEHYVVVHEVGEESVKVMDPARGPTVLSRERFLRLWRDGVVLLLRPGKELVEGPSTPWLRWVWRYLSREQTWLVQAAFLGAAYTGLSLLTAVFVQMVVDRFLPRRELELLVLSAALLVGVQVVRAGANFLRQAFLIRLRKRMSEGMIEDLLSRLFSMPAGFFDRRRAGDIAARLDDAVVIQDSVFLFAGGAVADVLVVCGCTVAAFYFAPSLAWIALTALPLYGLVVAWGARPIRSEQRAVLEAYGSLQASWMDGILGSSEVRNYRASGMFAQMNAVLHERFQREMATFQLTRARISVLAEVGGGILVVAILFTGSLMILAGELQLGAMLAVYAVLSYMLPSVGRLAEMHIAFRQASGAAQRLFEVLGREPEDVSTGSSFELCDEVELRDVTFGWPGAAPVLKGASLRLRRGEIVGLHGRNGSGKSTLVRILQRSYEPLAGSVLVDGRPASEVSLVSWRREVALVPEEVKLFHGTIADNVLMGRDGRGLAKLTALLTSVGLDDFFQRFPRGLGTFIGEAGRRLSSGERQVVGFLRALLDGPAVLVVDEGLNGLDFTTLARVTRLLEEYARDHVVLVVSHDPRSLDLCHRLVSLEEGRLSEAAAYPAPKMPDFHSAIPGAMA